MSAIQKDGMCRFEKVNLTPAWSVREAVEGEDQDGTEIVHAK